MPSIGEENGSTKSIRSSSPSSHSTERPVSVHDHEDQEKVVALGSLPLSPRPSFSNKAASILTNGTNNPDYEVDWDDEIDPNNPRNWSIWYKGFTIFSISWSVRYNFLEAVLPHSCCLMGRQTRLESSLLVRHVSRLRVPPERVMLTPKSSRHGASLCIPHPTLRAWQRCNTISTFLLSLL